MDMPVLKYIFGTVTKNKEKTKVYLVVHAKLLDGSKPAQFCEGELFNIKLECKK